MVTRKYINIVYITIAFAAGVLLATFLPLSWKILICCTASAVLLTVLNKYYFWQKSSIYILLLFVMLGAIRQYAALENMLQAEQALANRELSVTGCVVKEPVPRTGYTDYVVRVNAGKVLVKVKNPPPDVQVGDRLAVVGYAKAFEAPSNPGQFDYLAYCRQQGIAASVFCQSVEIIPGESDVTMAPVRIIYQVKHTLQKILKDTLQDDNYQIVNGLIFGGSQGIEDGFKRDLQKTGIIHILSVSGFHVGLLVGGILLLARSMRMGRRATLGLSVAGLLVYSLMTGLQPCVLRSALMALFPLIGYCLGQKHNWTASLTASGLLLLILNPANLFMAGTQLSFAATWGILYLNPMLQRVFQRVPGPVRAALSVTLSAQISTLPFLVHYFNYLSLISILANLIIGPIITLIIILACFSIGAGLVFLPLAGVINTLTEQMLLVVKFLTWVIARAPFNTVNLQDFSVLTAVLWFTLLVFLGGMFQKPSLRCRAIWLFKRRKKQLVVAGLIFVTVVVWSGIFWPQDFLQVTFLDVGEGDAAVVLTPDQRVMVIDTGNADNFVLVPYLRSLGIDRIDLLVISHFHADHTGGISELLGEFPVKEILFPAGGDVGLALKTLNLIRQHGVKCVAAAAGDKAVFHRGVVIDFLGPLPDTVIASEANENNGSAVLRLSYGTVSYLFPGDIQKEAVDNYCAQYGSKLNSTVIKVPHHGSKGSYVKEFYDKVAPRFAIISVGPNYFGHPDQGLIDAITARKIHVFRTDDNGAVTASTDGRQIFVSGFRGED